MGRKLKPIDEDEVARLAYEGASNREIGDIIGCDHKTVENRFSPLLKKKRAERRLNLRIAQTEAARSGNATLLIWLGKNELDQTDKPVPDDPVTHPLVQLIQSLVAKASPPGDG